MDENDLDRLLRHSAPTLSHESAVLATQLAREVRDREGLAASTPPRRRRPGLKIAAAVAVGAAALSGASTLAAYQLSLPPFQTIPDGVQRASDAVEITYRDADDRDVTCQVFAETRNLDRDALSTVNRFAADPRWDTFGQSVAGDLPGATAPDQQRAVFAAVDGELRGMTVEAVPGILAGDALAMSQEPGAPAFLGSAMSCDYGAGPR